MASPKEIIETIRKERFGIGLNTDATARNVIKRQQGIIHRSLEKLAEDLYSKQNHFVLELIQNADDNAYSSGVTPLLTFKIDEEKIIVQNNESGFTKKNVEALCDVGSSTKTKALGYIGEKGIGFKSVFRISDRPQIFSNGFRFEFRKNDGLNNFGFIVPHWISEQPAWVDKKLTNIALLLRKEVKGELSKFHEIEPTLLLFLNKLRTIEVYNVGELVNRIVRQDLKGKITLKHTKGESYWQIVRLCQKVPSDIREEKREGVMSTDLLLAFPLNRNGSANTATQQHLFAYLPTRQYGFKFIIQADFLVPASREDIHKDKDWNRWIRDSIATAFCNAVEVFKGNALLRTTFYNYIPLASEVVDPFFLPAVTQIQQALQESDCILTESRHWRKPSEMFQADGQVRSLIPNADLQRFFNKEYISTAVVADASVLNALGVKEFGINELLECLRNTEWLESQPDEWFIKLYTYLGKCSLTKAQLQELKKLKIVRLTRNRLVTAEEDQVFFPLDKKGNYGFEGELRILKRPLCDSKNTNQNNAVEAFLSKLDISRAKPYFIIEKHILSVYESDENKSWKNKGDEILIGHVRYIKDNLSEYVREHKQNNPIEEDPLRRLKESLWIKIASPQGTVHWRAQFLYLGKSYGNENDLEELFKGIDDEHFCFVDKQYVQDALDRLAPSLSGMSNEEKEKKEEAEIRGWRDFFVALGVETKIRVCKIGQGASLDYTCDDLRKLLQTGENARAIKALKILDKYWPSYSNSLQAGYSFEKKKSQFYRLLVESSWIPTKEKTSAKPGDVFLDKPEIRKILGKSGIYLGVHLTNKEFIKALGIHSEITIESALNHLKVLVATENTEQSIYEQLYRFLDRRFDSFADTIKNEFEKRGLIYIPGTSKLYFSAVEVLWKDAKEICGNSKGYLEGHYPRLKSFFVKSLEVDERPNAKDYASFLERLTEKDTITSDDEKQILRVYEELNRGLDPENNDHLISAQVWWASFINKPIFWTHRKTFKVDEGDILVADDRVLYELFKDNPHLEFLKLPSNYHLKIKHFLDAAGIPRISEAFESQLDIEEDPAVEELITDQIRFLVPYILRYLFQAHTDLYEKLKNDGTLDRLIQLKCYSVPNLHLTYFVFGQSASAHESAVLAESNLYLEPDKSDDTDYLAIELAKHFGNPPGLDDFLIALFEKKTEEKIERFLTAKKIVQLPPGEIEHFIHISNQIAEPIEEEASDWTDELEESDELHYDLEVEDTVDEAEGEEDEGELVELEEYSVIEDDSEIEVEENEEGGICIPLSPQSNGRAARNSSDNASAPTYTGNATGTTITSSPARPQRPSGFSEESKNTQPKKQNGAHKGGTGNGATGEDKTSWQAECEPGQAGIRIEKFVPSQRTPHGRSGNSTPGQKTISSNDGPDNSDGLSQEDKRSIGQWGERYALCYLREQLVKKYPGADLQDTDDGFNISQNGQVLVSVQWLNCFTDTGTGHDIKIQENGKDIFIEVKSSKIDTKEWFDISRRQWEFAETYQDQFYIYRVLNAGTRQAKLIEICNPFSLWEEGSLSAYPMRLHI